MDDDDGIDTNQHSRHADKPPARLPIDPTPRLRAAKDDPATPLPLNPGGQGRDLGEGPPAYSSQKKDQMCGLRSRHGLITGTLSAVKHYPRAVQMFMRSLRDEWLEKNGRSLDDGLPVSVMQSVQAAGKLHLLEIEATRQHKDGCASLTHEQLAGLRSEIRSCIKERHRIVCSLGLGKEESDPFGGE